MDARFLPTIEVNDLKVLTVLLLLSTELIALEIVMRVLRSSLPKSLFG